MPWVVVNVETGLPDNGSQKFPKLALRSAFEHRAEDRLLAFQKGDSTEVEIKGRDEWDEVVIKYSCLSHGTTQGSGSDFKKFYFSKDRTVQYMHVKKVNGQMEWTTDKFTMFPP